MKLNRLAFAFILYFGISSSAKTAEVENCLKLDTLNQSNKETYTLWMDNFKDKLLNDQNELFKQQFDYVFNAHVTIPFRNQNLKFFQLVDRPEYILVKNEDSTLPKFESFILLEVISTDPYKVRKVFSYQEKDSSRPMTDLDISEMICNNTPSCIEINKTMKLTEINAIKNAKEWAKDYVDEVQPILTSLVDKNEKSKKLNLLSEEFKNSIKNRAMAAVKEGRFDPPMNKSAVEGMEKALKVELCAQNSGVLLQMALAKKGNEREEILQRCDYYQGIKNSVSENIERLLMEKKKNRCFVSEKQKDEFCGVARKWKPVFENSVNRKELFK